jgi:hypothetical protein
MSVPFSCDERIAAPKTRRQRFEVVEGTGGEADHLALDGVLAREQGDTDEGTEARAEVAVTLDESQIRL